MKEIPLNRVRVFGMLDRRMVRVPEVAVPAAGMLLSYTENSYKRTWLNFSLPSFPMLASLASIFFQCVYYVGTS